ncbi:MAG: 2-phospho-L-lactate guanylyltransferase [Burkholderiales bacterium]|nr:2-phospho-L-lactate guanylyltransferase [Burkholderiales bacterium]
MNASRNTWAVLPVKKLEDAKRRLAARHPPEFRRELARAMLQDVLLALAAATALTGIVVVSVDPGVRDLAARFGARIFEDGARGGHTAAVMAAARRLAGEGRHAMLTVPSDIPCVTANEIDALVGAHGARPAFTIVPSHDLRGSNGIVVSPPDCVDLAFGDDSFARHVALARQVGIEPKIASIPGIALDIDEPADLARLEGNPIGPHTSAFLSR